MSPHYETLEGAVVLMTEHYTMRTKGHTLEWIVAHANALKYVEKERKTVIEASDELGDVCPGSMDELRYQG